MKKILLLLLLLPSAVFAQVAGDSALKIQTSTVVLESTPAIETSAYAPGDLIGEKISLTNAVRLNIDTGIISSVVIKDNDSESADIDVVFFDTDPSATTFTDNAALDIADADLANVICVVSVTDYYVFADNALGLAQNVNCPFDLNSGTTLYAALVARTAVTYTAATDLTLRVGVLQD